MFGQILILQIIIQQELQKLTKILPNSLKHSRNWKKEFYRHQHFWLWKQGKTSNPCIKTMLRRKTWKLLIWEEGKLRYVLTKNFNTFMYDHSLHCRKKHFCVYCLQTFITKEILKRRIKDCCKINSKKRSKMPKKMNIFDITNIDLCRFWKQFSIKR